MKEFNLPLGSLKHQVSIIVDVHPFSERKRIL